MLPDAAVKPVSRQWNAYAGNGVQNPEAVGLRIVVNHHVAPDLPWVESVPPYFQQADHLVCRHVPDEDVESVLAAVLQKLDYASLEVRQVVRNVVCHQPSSDSRHWQRQTVAMRYTVHTQRYGAFSFSCTFPICPTLGHFRSNLTLHRKQKKGKG